MIKQIKHSQLRTCFYARYNEVIFLQSQHWRTVQKSLKLTHRPPKSSTLMLIWSRPFHSRTVLSRLQAIVPRKEEEWTATQAARTNLQTPRVRLGRALWHTAITRLSAETQAQRLRRRCLGDRPSRTSCPLTENECADRSQLSPPRGVILKALQGNKRWSDAVFTPGVIVSYHVRARLLASPPRRSAFTLVILFRSRARLRMYTDQYSKWRHAQDWFANRQYTRRRTQRRRTDLFFLT